MVEWTDGTVSAEHGMVCTSQPLASEAGLQILKSGGNAVDAAICANATLGVVEPMSCGIGGDLFAIVWSQGERRLFGLNASGRAPYGWTRAAASDLGLEQLPTYGPLSWTVPGCVSGWQALNERFGGLDLASLLQAAIHHAADGFAVTPVAAGVWATIESAGYPSWANTFAPGGRSPCCGETFTNPDLARTLETLAGLGPDAFYRGAIAERIVAFSTRRGGRLSMRDFNDHTINWIDPVTSSYRGFDVWQLPPSGQGIAALQMLNILELHDIAAMGPNSAAHLHVLIEAKKLVYEDRAAYYADPEFSAVPVVDLISKAYAQRRAQMIDLRRAAQVVERGTPRSDTVCVATADAQGNMVSLIQSIYHPFGSREVPDGLGFALQNRGADFSLDRAHVNRLEPHKRPFHTIIPGFVTQNGRPVFAFGVVGADFQPQGHAQVLMNLIDFGMSVQQAGDRPRVAHFGSSSPAGVPQTGGGEVACEHGIPDDVRRQLAERGHIVRPGVDTFGGFQGIWRTGDPPVYYGGSDVRKDGCALGY